MIEISNTRYFSASSDALFSILADPENMVTCLPHVRDIVVLEQEQGWARVATRFSLGPFGQFRSEGVVYWHDNMRVSFESSRPLPVQAQWQLTSVGSGTDLDISLTIDLLPLLGPLAALVPETSITNMLLVDLAIALDAIDARLQVSAGLPK